MPQPHMFGLRGIKAKVLYGIVARVAVNVMNNLGGAKIAADMLLHYIAMYQDVLKPTCGKAIGGIRMIIRGDYQDIAILPDLATAFPARRKLLAFAEHGVIYAFHPFAEHRVFITRYIPTIRWVGASKVGKGTGAILGAKLTRATFVALNVLAAMLTLYDSSREESFSWHDLIIACGR